MTEEFQPYPLPRSYRITPRTDEIDKVLLRAQNIETLDGTLRDFHTAALLSIDVTNLDTDGCHGNAITFHQTCVITLMKMLRYSAVAAIMGICNHTISRSLKCSRFRWVIDQTGH